MPDHDVLDRFTQWDVDASNQEWYVYDAVGNRVLKRTTSLSGTVLTTFLLEGWRSTRSRAQAPRVEGITPTTAWMGN